MAKVIGEYDASAKGARIAHSVALDSIPFELGVWFAEETAKAKLGTYVARVKGRIRAMQGGLSGGTAASGAATMAAIQKDPSLGMLMMNPFALTPGFQGPDQPPGNAVEHDADIGADVGPFMMAMINTKNVHRANALLGHRWSSDFKYDEMSVVVPGAPTEFTGMGPNAPKPGVGPSKAEREAGFYDIAFIGIAADARQVKVSVKAIATQATGRPRRCWPRPPSA